MIFPDLESAVNAQDAAPASELKPPPLKTVGTPRIRRVYGRPFVGRESSDFRSQFRYQLRTALNIGADLPPVPCCCPLRVCRTLFPHRPHKLRARQVRRAKWYGDSRLR